MLYNPSWQPDKVYERVSLKAFIGWLEKQNPEATYNFCMPQECALAQFLQQTTGCTAYRSNVNLGVPGTKMEIPEAIWLYRIVNDKPMTFGGALERARAALVTSQG